MFAFQRAETRPISYKPFCLSLVMVYPHVIVVMVTVMSCFYAGFYLHSFKFSSGEHRTR